MSLARTERRRAEKLKSKLKKTYTLTQEQLAQAVKKGIDSERHRLLTENVKDYSLIMAWGLVEKLGFGKKRADEFLKFFANECDALHKGYINTTDIERELLNKKIYIK